LETPDIDIPTASAMVFMVTFFCTILYSL